MTPQLLLWIGLAVALAYFPLSSAAISWSRSLIKTVPLTLFALSAFFGAAPAWLVAGLAFSALGDFALSRRGEAAFLYGLSAFALAHVVYVILFLSLSGAPLWAAFSTQPMLAIALLAFGLSAEVWLAPHLGKLRWPVRAYVAVITLMGLAVLTMPFGIATFGALLFIASDTMLAVQLFRLSDDHQLAEPLGWGVWASYIVGQALILAGAG